ncbi:MAG: shikimate dehydrogenase family protein [Bacteroidia bacterium]
MKKLGLIGFPLSHSFSQKYFTQKFTALGLKDWQYELFPIEYLKDFPDLVARHPELVGLNVTIPHKVNIIKFLDELHKEAETVGAVNTIKISIYNNGKKYLKGYNTDVYGFEFSLKPLLKPHHTKALILGTGGASKAVKFVLDKLGIESQFVSRNPNENQLSYISLDEKILQEHLLIINTTPLGMQPNINSFPEIPYQYLTENHLVYDLVYNPEETLLLQKAKAQGAQIKNGLEMLHLQAEKAWEIFSKE